MIAKKINKYYTPKTKKATGKPFANESATRLANYLKSHKDDYSTEALTKDQEKILVNKYKDSPEKLQELLVLDNIKLVYRLAKKYSSTSKDFDEMISRGIEGLSIAAKEFDLEKNAKFSTYAAKWIRKYLLKEFYTRESMSKRFQKYLSAGIDTCISSYDSSNQDYDLSSNSYDDSSTVQSIYDTEKEQLAHTIQGLVEDELDFTENEIAVYDRLILGNESIKQVANDLDLSAHATTRLKTGIIEKIQTALKEKYNCELEEIF